VHPCIINEGGPAVRDQRLAVAFGLQRINMVAPRFAIEQIDELPQLLGILRREIVSLTLILVEVV
jgi:hypothetical protein